MSVTATEPESAPLEPIDPTEEKDPVISRGWVQGVALVMLFGFFVMGILAYRTYTASMPLPDKVVTQSGEPLFSGADITRGQEIFQARGLMQYGSINGHGAYLGPDFTADYLRRSTENVGEQMKAKGVPQVHDAVVKEFRTNRYNSSTKTLTYTDYQVNAFNALTKHYAQFLGPDSRANGLPADFITDPGDIRDLTAFFSWSAWAAAADRPGHDYSYTNNWPAEPRVDNGPTADLIVWSALSLIALLGGTGIMFAVYGRWSQRIGWHSNTQQPLVSYKQPGEVKLTSSQRATVFFFLIIAVLFLMQALLGALTEHYRADLSSFFGLNLNALLPYNLAR
ncbi:MAG: nitric-oxide reductase large subunit, partial [Acidimicrobiia bacterium]